MELVAQKNPVFSLCHPSIEICTPWTCLYWNESGKRKQRYVYQDIFTMYWMEWLTGTVPWKLLSLAGVLKPTFFFWFSTAQRYPENTSNQGVSQIRSQVLKTLWTPAANVCSWSKSWVFINSLTS